MNHQVLLLFFFIFSSFSNLSLSDPRATEAALVCTNRTASITNRKTFAANFLAAMNTFTPLIVRQRYAAFVNGSGDTKVYAFGECMKDLDQSDCNVCFAQCKAQVLRCLPFQSGTRGGRLFYDGCYLRYDDYNFFGESLSQGDTTVCATKDVVGSSNRTGFRANVMALVTNLSVEAPKNDGFFVRSMGKDDNVSVYGLAQCWELVNASACGSCLADAVSRVTSCLPKEEGRVLNAGCYLRYSTRKFYYNSSVPPVSENPGRRRLAIILATTFSAMALTLIIGAAIFFVNKKLVKKREESKQLGALSPLLNKSKLNFSYESLEKATDYFDDSNKLGHGGSGSVYKGTLSDGKVVAVKRLLFNTRQWVDHFFNEVNLISGIHHKNLVKLLGCSITGPESLLVYEYVSNQSLHDYLFVRRDVEPLRWEARYKIVLGTAEGLAYLHEESKLRIIHRDIKPSNILLDEDLNPKIADFGLVRLFPEDKSHISTAVAGTLGYMAPEYAVRGKLSEKADVYSFGVFVVEITCGRRNKCFSPDVVCILHMVWDYYAADKLREAVDPVIEYHFQEKASRLLQIGLLCVQASAEIRPSMSRIMQMLTEDTLEIPRPMQPPPFYCVSSSEVSQNITAATCNSQPESHMPSLGNSTKQCTIEPRRIAGSNRIHNNGLDGFRGSLSAPL
ncbi:Cysteine-rich receptor-like protein kinase 3 [Hibiscus syriacus]|uniref:Cysteine-rich receptor-like protein kinase 3 n=1 Tax=Hibiscus syriacus TaxID=106335 RepID=A0A6A3AV50_HIBSY|nr:cysteine-rich receptor-like protein kinase 3 [Hibiscus syriacus]KAE8707267.1 Cysteine-rich receptor-like protein kinase 3 [Hibiscus syriacus]